MQDEGQYLNRKDGCLASIQFEAWCDVDLYCWHWNVGRAGTNNGINVLMSSRLLKDIFNGRFKFRLPQTYRIIPEGEETSLVYLLAGSIYQNFPLFFETNKKYGRRSGKEIQSVAESCMRGCRAIVRCVEEKDSNIAKGDDDVGTRRLYMRSAGMNHSTQFNC